MEFDGLDLLFREGRTGLYMASLPSTPYCLLTVRGVKSGQLLCLFQPVKMTQFQNMSHSNREA